MFLFVPDWQSHFNLAIRNCFSSMKRERTCQVTFYYILFYSILYFILLMENILIYTELISTQEYFLCIITLRADRIVKLIASCLTAQLQPSITPQLHTAFPHWGSWITVWSRKFHLVIPGMSWGLWASKFLLLDFSPFHRFSLVLERNWHLLSPWAPASSYF